MKGVKGQISKFTKRGGWEEGDETYRGEERQRVDRIARVERELGREIEGSW